MFRIFPWSSPAIPSAAWAKSHDFLPVLRFGRSHGPIDGALARFHLLWWQLLPTDRWAHSDVFCWQKVSTESSINGCMMHIYCIVIAYWFYIYCILFIVYIYCIFILYLLYIYFIFILYSFHIYSVFISMFIVYLVYIYCILYILPEYLCQLLCLLVYNLI